MIDWTDPCARALKLRESYYSLVSGTAEVSYQYQAEGVLRAVTWAKADLSRLESEMLRAEAECSALGGVAAKPRRFAIQGGFRRNL